MGRSSALLVAVVVQAWLAAPAAAAELTVGEAGLGPISAATGFNRQAIQKALPGFVVKFAQRSTEGESYRVLLVGDAASTLAEINPTAGEKGIFSIRIGSNKVRNALGPAIGASYTAIYGARAIAPDCVAGEEEMSGKVICPHPGSRHVSYVLQGRSNSPDGQLPALATLGKFTVKEIVWRP